MNRRELLFAGLACLARPAHDPRLEVERGVRALSRTADGHLWLHVVDPEGPVLRRRFGYDRQDPVPLGSVRKWLTAACVMAVVDQGKLRLDDPVGRWLPAWDLPDRAEVTLRRLLCHTGGLKKRPRNGFCQGLGTLGACVDRMAEAPLAATPGTEFRYSSAGFHVAARVLEVVTGRSFAELLQSLLLDPLQMEETTVRPAGPELDEMTGEIWSSPPDFSRFLQMLLAEGTFRGRRLLSAAAVGELEAGQVRGERFVGGVPAKPWWPPGHSFYALGTWRNAEDATGRTTVVTAEGNGAGTDWFVAWLDRRALRAGCMALEAPRGAREPFRELVTATCEWAGADDCRRSWGLTVGDAGD